MQKVGRASHPDGMQTLLHAGAGLGERTLKLAPRREDPGGEVIDGESIVVVAHLDQRKRLFEEGSAPPRAGCVSWSIHVPVPMEPT